MSHDHCKPVRYNRGMLRKEERAIGTVWVFRWSEEANGQRRQHKEVSSPGESHPEALVELYVSLSTHTAPS